ncbi:MAG: hypothetical protein HLUCCX21_04305, partial [Porphyrobacter sp. HL-46]
DGAEPLAMQAGEGDELYFAIGADRYRIPNALMERPVP